MIKICLTLICFYSIPSFSQIDITPEITEQRLVGLSDSTLFGYTPEIRTVSNELFIKNLIQYLKKPNSFDNPLTELSKKINIIYAPDHSFRILNWEVGIQGSTYRYYATVQMKSEELKLYPLIDYSAELIENGMDSVLNNKKWFGGLIYEIIKKQFPDGRSYYVLLSFNRAGLMTNRKIMDILAFNKNKQIIMGLPIINTKIDGESKVCTRLLLEYNKNATVSLNYDKEKDVIYYDALSSEVNNNKLKYTFIPIGIIEAMKWTGEYWEYIPNYMQVTELKNGEAPISIPVKKSRKKH